MYYRNVCFVCNVTQFLQFKHKDSYYSMLKIIELIILVICNSMILDRHTTPPFTNS